MWDIQLVDILNISFITIIRFEIFLFIQELKSDFNNLQQTDLNFKT